MTRPLTPRERLVVHLRYYADWTFEEIALGVGVASGTIRKSHASALRKLAHGYETRTNTVEARERTEAQRP